MTSRVFAVIVSAFTVPIFVSILFLPAFVFAETPPASEPPAFLKDIKSEADIDKLSPEQKTQFEEFLKNDSAPSLVGSSVVAPEGSVACFDYYHFGSVQVDLSSTLAATVPGATIGFIGTVKNANTYPLVDGQVYVKIFRKGGDESLIHQNGYALVDQFALPDTFTLPANGEKSASFAWKVPENAPTGDYMAAFFFETAKRYNLLGLSFTDDVTGNQAQFSVKNSTDSGVVAFDKNSVTKNGEPHHFAAFLSHFTKDEPVTITTKLVNPRNETVVVPVTWKLYAWDSLRAETLKDTKTELVQLQPNETRELSYAANPISASASYLVIETKDGNSKSILDIRFARDGVEETRINFPGITDFPLQQGKETTVFSCAHSTNLPVVKDNLLTLTLKDDQGKIIHSYKYQGDITGDMMGVKDAFTPDQTYDNFTLTATLERRGTVVEEVTAKYNCQDIDPSLCSKPGANVIPTGSAGRGAALAILAVITLLLGILGWKLWKGRKNKNLRTFSFLFAFLLSGILLFGGETVEAKGVTSHVNGIPELAQDWVGVGSVHETDDVPLDTTPWGAKWLLGLTEGASASVGYSATLIDNNSGEVINDGSSVPIGTVIRVERQPAQNTDISWNGTGAAYDTPFGYWVESAGPQARACHSEDQTYSELRTLGGVIAPVIAYTLLDVDPTIEQIISPSSNLSCVGGLCTVTGAGPVSIGMKFPETYGRFYYRYLDHLEHYGGGCRASNVPMREIDSCTHDIEWCRDWGHGFVVKPEPYNLIIPDATVTWNLTASLSGNQAPSIPSVTGPATGTVSTSYAFTATSTDPDGDTLRYRFDWDNDGVGDELVPVQTGDPSKDYVTSGISQTLSHPWPTANTYTIKVRAEDDRGGISSGWASTIITISAAVNGVCGPADTATGGITFSSAPTFGLCQNAALPAVSGSGPWTWTCLGSSGGTNASCQADPTGPLPQLEVCLNDGGLIPVAAGNGGAYTIPGMSIGNTKTFQTFYDPFPGDCGGSAPVTGSTLWNAGINTPSDAVSFTSAGVLQANVNGSETVSVSRNGQMITMNANVSCSVVTPACDNGSADAETTCRGEQYDVTYTNNCTGLSATQQCPGTRYCDYNWKEVTP